MNRTQIDNLAAQATADILGVPVLDRYKFAELLIQECCQVVSDSVTVCVNDSGSPAYPVTRVKLHFGIIE